MPSVNPGPSSVSTTNLQAIMGSFDLNGNLIQAFGPSGVSILLPTSQIVGTTTNNNAAGGIVGEYITATVAPATVTLVTATPKTIASIILTAGDWEVGGVVNYTPTGTTSITVLAEGISIVADTLPAQDRFAQLSIAANVPGTTTVITQPAPNVRLSLAATTTVLMVASATFTASTLTGGGTVWGLRVR